jgi:hypothetical protein
MLSKTDTFDNIEGYDDIKDIIMSSTSSGISGKSSNHHGYCSYSDYKSNACT